MRLNLMRYSIIAFLYCFCCFSYINVCHGENSKSQFELDYLFKPGCLKCIKVEKQLIELKNKYPLLVINQYNVADTDNLEDIINLLEKYSVPEDQGFLTPAVFIGNHYYIKNAINLEKIEQIIKLHSSAKLKKPELAMTSGQNVFKTKEVFLKQASSKLNSFSYLAIFMAGLIDGVNPCAFALLIFFLSYLKIAGRTKKQLIEVGLAYSISVFVTYFLIGLGFFHGFKMLISEYSYIAVGLYIFSGSLACLCAMLSFWDIYLLYGKNKREQKVILQLGSKTKKLTHKLIRNNSRGVYVIVGAVFIGVGVSFLELGCTGQVYLPVISFMLQQKIIFSKALLLLLIYNSAFILPLLLIFVLAVFGMTHIRLSSWFQNNLVKIKFLTASLFLILGLVLFVQVFS